MVPTAPAPAPLNILMVEDNATNRLVVGDILRLAEHHVAEACDGREGVDMAAAQPFDLILMDISMPRMDGVEAARLIRASDGPNQATPIIGLTAHAMVDERKEFLDAGLNACITKPFRLQALYDALGFQAAPRTGVPGAETNPSSAVIDENILDELAEMLPPERIEQTIRQVCNEIETEIPAILDPAAEVAQIGKRAHRLAGSAAIVGAERLAQMLREIESAAKAEEPEKLKAALIELPDVGRLTTAAALLRRVAATA